MKLFVIGASGRTGREIVEQGLARGHAITAPARSPEKLTQRHPSLSVVKGDPLDRGGLARAIPGHDAVISVLGPHEPFKPSTLMLDSARAIVGAMEDAGVKRLMVLSAAAHFSGIPPRIARLVLREHMRDSIKMEGVVRTSSLQWTLARPPALTQGRSPHYRSRTDALPPLGLFLSRRALAAFMLDSLEENLHLREVVGVAR
jgi:putative NADH-flavin reductase